MPTCAECSEMLLEYLYGLLDESEAEVLRAHVAACSSCKEALAKATNQQSLLARAARKYSDVPTFQLPADEVAPTLANDIDHSPALENPRPHTLPLQGPERSAVQPDLLNVGTLHPQVLTPHGRRQKSWRLWLAVGAAAAMVLVSATLLAFYHWGLTTRQQALADARKQVESIDDRLESWEANVAAERAGLTAKLQAKFLQVDVIGPATVQPGAANVYRVTTQTPLGQAAPVEVAVKLLAKVPGQEIEQVQFRKTYKSTGELQIVLPDKLPVQSGATQRLRIEASNGVAKEVIEQPLATAVPCYVTHISLNKTTYHPGETVFFRSVTLERFGLTPIDRPVALRFTFYRVTGGNPEPIKYLQTTTGVGGVAGGDFALPADLALGQYLFALAEIPATTERPFTVEAAIRHMSIEQVGQHAKTGDAKKKDKANAKQQRPLARPGFKAEFFPEGGDLVDNTPDRVYFRLQAGQALPENLAAVVEDSQKHEVASVTLESEGPPRAMLLGSFSFTPQAGETYRFRLTAGGKIVDRFALPAVLPNGVALMVRQAVLAAGQPLQVRVHNPRRQSLLVLLNCRGRTVDQKIIENAGTLTDVSLQPPQGCHGVMRLTVFTPDGDNWRPAAERLVYRHPAHFLELSAILDKSEAKGYKPGDAVSLRIESRNEAKALSPSWLLAAVVDDTALRHRDSREAGLPAYFLLTSALEAPEDLEDGDVLLTNSGSADQALDLILGTQGWRRFAPRAAGMSFLAAATDKKGRSSDVALFKAGNRLGVVFEQYSRAAQTDQADLAMEQRRRLADLHDERAQAAAQAIGAARSLASYQEQILTWLRQSLGILLTLLVVVGAALLCLGLVTALRARSSPRLWLASSSAILMLAIVLFVGTNSLRTAENGPVAPTLLSWLTPREPPLPADVGGIEKGRDKEALARAESPKVSALIYTRAQPEAPPLETTLERAVSDAKALAAAGANAAALKAAGVLAKPAAGGKGGKGGKAGGGFGGGGIGGFGGAGKPQPPLPQMNKQAAAKEQSRQSNFGQAMPKSLNNRQQNMAITIPADAAVLREYANANSQPGFHPPGLLLWQPLLAATDGTARVAFDLPPNPAGYSILIQGHTADGRLGVYHGKLEAK